MKIVLGPCLCQGCDRLVYWGRRIFAGEVTGDTCWRDVTDTLPHVCTAGPSVYAVEQEILKLEAKARDMGVAI